MRARGKAGRGRLRPSVTYRRKAVVRALDDIRPQFCDLSRVAGEMRAPHPPPADGTQRVRAAATRPRALQTNISVHRSSLNINNKQRQI